MNIPVPRDAVQIEGKPKVYVDTGGSGKSVHRHFCGDCGSWVSLAQTLTSPSDELGQSCRLWMLNLWLPLWRVDCLGNMVLICLDLGYSFGLDGESHGKFCLTKRKLWNDSLVWWYEHWVHTVTSGDISALCMERCWNLGSKMIAITYSCPSVSLSF